MLLETAVGDAYGAGFEYADDQFVARNNTLKHYVQHPRHKLRPGCYTDDTQMSIAIVEAVVSGEPWTEEKLAERFVSVFKRDPRKGYSQGFYKILCKVGNGKELLAALRPDSDKSGAAMRAGPIGVYPDIDNVIDRCSTQASITHNTPDGINAAVAASLMTHYFVYRLGPRKDLGSFLCDHVPGNWNTPWSGAVGSKGWMSVRAAITALHTNSTMSHVLHAAVAFTGDVDTVAAIALAAGSGSSELEQDLPKRLIDELERGPYGRSFLEGLDKSLRKAMDGM
jgi:ADP-ribosyl-[dinitrogen reductase] hydrolase